ncbi:SDR family oxidoreductase [Mycoavidus sp. B2-EB]|uniref:SDR family oxidoreductase n=1 Tax=Mycoavidus sp. B2-EB TaxID=2651972 RepID=UPI001625E690|nr:SDR family oxidoreductase [Mycoavidus sp. B2-EB]BBO59625.1 non-ribosomal peptide synthetase [Mycoavidus sp. B2-EB]
MNLFVTGASGFLGAHTIVQWLCQQPNGTVAGLVRAPTDAAARDKLMGALKQALYDQNLDLELAQLEPRITVLRGDIAEYGWHEQAAFKKWFAAGGRVRVLHNAANQSLRDEDRRLVWRHNVEGTRVLLSVLLEQPGIESINYISTAYVTGTREGHILEDATERPPGFNNSHEESKWHAEQIVKQVCSAQRLPYRIFRPSILVGHSVTYRAFAMTGFYAFIDRLLRTKQRHALQGSAQKLMAPSFKRAATLNLVPVDLAALEILDLMEQGVMSAYRCFHITNEHPFSVADLCFALEALLDMQFSYSALQQHSLVELGLCHYLPYLMDFHRFDRRNVHLFGTARYQERYLFDLTRLRELVSVFLKQRAQAGMLRQDNPAAQPVISEAVSAILKRSSHGDAKAHQWSVHDREML